MFVLLLLVTLLASTPVAHATNYYFSNAGADANPCTSTGAPCQTLTRAQAIIDSWGTGAVSHTLNFNGGQIFTEASGSGPAGLCGTFDGLAFINKHGISAASPILVQSYGTGRATIRKDTTDFGNGICIQQSSFISVDNIEINGNSNFSQALNIIGSTDVSFTNMEAYNTNGSLVFFGAMYVTGTPCVMTTSHRGIFRYLDFYEGNKDGTSGGEIFYIGKDPLHVPSGCSNDTSSNITIEFSELHNTSHELVECKGNTTNCFVRDNYLHDSYGDDCVQACNTAPCGGHVFERNFIKNCALRGMTFGAAGGAANLISHNIIKDANDRGISTSATIATITFNTVYSATNAGVSLGGTITQNDNIVWASGSANDTTDPQFVDPVNDDFTPQNTNRHGTGAGGKDKGMVQRILRASSAVATATPNRVNTTWTSVFPMTQCTIGSRTINVAGANRTSSTCTITGNTTTDLDFSGAAVTPGQTILETDTYGALRAGAIGLPSNPVRPHRSVAVTSGAVTNNVTTAAPTLTSCTVPDSATDNHIIMNVNVQGASPISPTSGITGFSFTEAGVSKPLTGGCIKTAGLNQVDCTTSAAVGAGLLIAGTYNQSTGNLVNAVGAELSAPSFTCANQVAAPPAAPSLDAAEISATNPTKIDLTIDPASGTMTLNGGNCNGLSCTGTLEGALTLSTCTFPDNVSLTITPSMTLSPFSEYTCSYSQATGNITNGTTELAAFSNFPVVNNLPDPAYVMSQYEVRVHQYNETLDNNSLHWITPRNTAAEVMPGGSAFLAFGLTVTGTGSTPSHGLAVRCQDNGGAVYTPTDLFGSHLVSYTDSPRYENLKVLPTRVLTNPGGGSTYDDDGRIVDQASSYPTKVRTAGSDTAMVVSFQVSPLAIDGDGIACFLVIEPTTLLDAYTPAQGTVLLRVREKVARGL